MIQRPEPIEKGNEWVVRFTTELGSNMTFTTNTREAALAVIDTICSPSPPLPKEEAGEPERKPTPSGERVTCLPTTEELQALAAQVGMRFVPFDKPTAGSRLIEGAKEALAIANGEQPAAAIWVDGFKYVPAVTAEPGAKAPWPDPTPEMLADPLFEAIWQVIKSWDINVPAQYGGYCGATGNHARAILDAVRSAEFQSAPPAPADTEIREALKVKPLAWFMAGHDAVAKSPVGPYEILKAGGFWAIFVNCENTAISRHDNMEAAKDAAQADFEERIRSALA